MGFKSWLKRIKESKGRIFCLVVFVYDDMKVRSNLWGQYSLYQLYIYIYILFLWFNSSKLVNITIKWVVEIENYFTTIKKELYFLQYKKYYIESIQELHQKYEVLSQNFVGNHVLWCNHIIGQIRKHCYFQTILYKTNVSTRKATKPRVGTCFGTKQTMLNDRVWLHLMSSFPFILVCANDKNTAKPYSILQPISFPLLMYAWWH